MHKIYGNVKKYSWGTKNFLPEFLNQKEDGEPWAEYWMEGPSFLFKVLSIAEPLSIQCHPNDYQASTRFNEGNPNYSSPKGKPEIVCALSDVKARCGIKEGVSKEYVIDILKNHQNNLDSYLDNIMNTVVLNPGQAMYIEPGTLHQYLSGNAVELMNYSDNVIRGGMTNKKVDIDELEKIGKFENQKPVMVKINIDNFGRDTYITDCDKFELKHARPGIYSITESKDTIAVVTSGSASFGSIELKRGECIYIDSNTTYTLDNLGDIYFAS